MTHDGFKNGQRTACVGKGDSIPISECCQRNKTEVNEAILVAGAMLSNLKRARLGALQEEIDKDPHETEKQIPAHGGRDHFGCHLLLTVDE